ncbi:MAG: hypothetical protein WCL42_10300, partial [Chlorobiaceae bacterium]
KIPLMLSWRVERFFRRGNGQGCRDFSASLPTNCSLPIARKVYVGNYFTAQVGHLLLAKVKVDIFTHEFFC